MRHDVARRFAASDISNDSEATIILRRIGSFNCHGDGWAVLPVSFEGSVLVSLESVVSSFFAGILRVGQSVSESDLKSLLSFSLANMFFPSLGGCLNYCIDE